MRDALVENHSEHVVQVIEDGQGSSARVLPEYGFNCFSFRCRVAGRELELLASDDHFAEHPSGAAGNGTPILFPFPNRIRGGKFEFGGKTYTLPRNERGVNAIHGLVLDRPWRVHARGGKTGTVTGEFQLFKDAPSLAPLWPADFRIEVTYSLEAGRLTSRVRVSNPDTRPLPWGFGTHPYFRLPLKPAGDEKLCSIVAPVTATWELEDLLPTGRRLPLSKPDWLAGKQPFSELKFDDVFTGLTFEDGWCRCRLIDRELGVTVRFHFDKWFRELVIYTPPTRRAISLEPYTCVTDAVNLQPRGIDAGLRVLMPGESTEGIMILEAVPS